LEDWGGGCKLWVRGVKDSFPLDFGFLEIDEEAEGSVGGPQVVEALRGVFVGETVGTLEFDDEDVFDEEVGEVFTDAGAFVAYFERRFGFCLEAAEGEFAEEGSCVDFLQESGAQGVGDLEDSVEDVFGQ
jgi:hypothetical protein